MPSSIIWWLEQYKPAWFPLVKPSAYVSTHNIIIHNFTYGQANFTLKVTQYNAQDNFPTAITVAWWLLILLLVQTLESND